MHNTCVSKLLPTGWKNFRLSSSTRMNTNASQKKSNAGNSSTTYLITWKPPWFHKYLILGRSITWQRRWNHSRLYKNMDIFQLQPNPHASLLLNQLRTLVEITARIGRQTTRKQVLTPEEPLQRKQLPTRIQTGKWLTRYSYYKTK